MTQYLGDKLISGVAYPTEPTRNLGQIIESLVPLTDAGLHLLDGALINGAGIYSDFVTAMGDIYSTTEVVGYKSNVTKVGSLIDTDGVLSGFSTDNYALTSSAFLPNANNWEIVVKFNTMTQQSGDKTIIGAGDSFALNITSSQPELYLSSNNSSWDIASSITGSTTLSNNTDYWLKLVFNGSSYVLYLSTTGEFNGEETTEVTVTSSTKVYSGNIVCIGKYKASSPSYYWGSIDLRETYININGNRWWTGADAIKPMFCDEVQWQSSVSTYGVCGKFVYDSVANTVRLPKITGIIEGTTDATALGDLVEAGLPNITGNITKTSGSDALMQATPDQITQTGALAVAPYQSKAYLSPTGNSNMAMGINFNASRSSSIYGNSSTVQPQTIKCYYYIVIATTTKTEIEVDIDEIATDLNGKADVDLTNLSPDCKTIDGQWVSSSVTLVSNGAAPTADTDFDLSTYLPNDGYNYEVVVSGNGTTGSTSGNQQRIQIISQVIHSGSVILWNILTRTASTMVGGGYGILPIGANRKLTVKQHASNTGTYNLVLRGYRRIGTN